MAQSITTAGRTEKRCGMCGVVKPLSEFHRCRKRPDGRGARCKSCACAYQAVRRQMNPEQVKETTRAWKANHKRSLLAYQRRYSAANRDRINLKQREWRERHKAHYKEWQQTYYSARNAAKRMRTPKGEVTRIPHREIAERDSWKCHLCGGAVTQKNWSLDHLVPLSKGGDHSRANVALAHYDCNRKRQAGLMHAQLLIFG